MRLSFLVMTDPGGNTLKGTFWMCWDRCLQAVSRRGTFWTSSKSGHYRLFDEGECPAGEGRRRRRGSFTSLNRGHSKQVTGGREVREGKNPRVWEQREDRQLLYERSFRKMFSSKWNEKQWKARKLGFPKRQCF